MCCPCSPPLVVYLCNFYYIYLFVYLFICVHAFVPWRTSGGWRTTLRGHHFFILYEFSRLDSGFQPCWLSPLSPLSGPSAYHRDHRGQDWKGWERNLNKSFLAFTHLRNFKQYCVVMHVLYWKVASQVERNVGLNQWIECLRSSQWYLSNQNIEDSSPSHVTWRT